MAEPTLNVGSNGDHSDDAESGGMDLEKLRELVGFALRAARRRLALAIATFVIVTGLGLTVAKLMPRVYAAQVKLLAQRSTPIRMLTAQNPGMDSADNPTKNVVAMVMGQDSLVGLAKDANLVERFERSRPRILQLKDSLMERFFGAPSDQDKLLGMAYTLERHLNVETDDMTVTITVEWTDAQAAYDLVTLVQRNFSEARYDSDVAVVNSSIAVLEEHAKNELAQVDEELKEFNKNVVEKSKLTHVPPARGAISRAIRLPATDPLAGGDTPAGPDPELTASLEEKRLRIRALEESQQRSVDALQSELQRQELTLTPLHPTVVALQQELEAARRPSPELVQLRGDVRALMAQIAPPRPLPVRSATPVASSLPALLGAASPAASTSASGETAPTLLKDEVLGPLALSESRLSLAMKAYQEALARLDTAKVELEIARTIYKERYKVLTPAEVPRGPKKATARMVAMGSVLGAGLFAILFATALDLIGGAVIESWQIRRRLKLDVLGELDSPSPSR
jgi:hypothetical protein